MQKLIETSFSCSTVLIFRQTIALVTCLPYVKGKPVSWSETPISWNILQKKREKKPAFFAETERCLEHWMAVNLSVRLFLEKKYARYCSLRIYHVADIRQMLKEYDVEVELT